MNLFNQKLNLNLNHFQIFSACFAMCMLNFDNILLEFREHEKIIELWRTSVAFGRRAWEVQNVLPIFSKNVLKFPNFKLNKSLKVIIHEFQFIISFASFILPRGDI